MEFVVIWGVIVAIANDAETVANFILVFAFLRWLYGFRWRTFEFIETSKDGEVRTFSIALRARDVNASSMTNAVSSAFYDGGFLPPDVRQQVIEFTNPTYKVG